MPFLNTDRLLRQLFRMSLAIALVGMFATQVSIAQNQLKEPVYRVPNNPQVTTQQPTNQPIRVAQQPINRRQVPNATRPAQRQTKTPFDLVQRPGEHPLMPAMRVAQQGIKEIDTKIRDYQCVMVKQERVNGKLGEVQNMFLKVRHQPFSVHIAFLEPYKGREVLYVAGENNGKLYAKDCGWKGKFGAWPLDPLGDMAMEGQKYPITKIGLRNLTTELVMVAKADSKFAECTVKTDPNTRVEGRSTTMIEVTHPVPRRNFRFHIARIYLDNELRVPIRYEAYLWPTTPGGKPVLDEMYTYRNLKINNGFTARDFSKDNPELFKR